ncbi:MAG: hypothetical protein K0R15_1315 [Clostridiales bacterium]|jgi:hypothetical protein|nr:hypothetical protein [Clostridiales bacterium]
MGISVSAAVSQSNGFGNYASNLRLVQTSLNNYKSTMNNCWNAEEMVHINTAIEVVNANIVSAISVLDGLKSDVTSVAYEIKREEEAAAAARAAAEARAREAAARAREAAAKAALNKTKVK